MSPHSDLFATFSVDPASPVLLTKTGPLGGPLTIPQRLFHWEERSPQGLVARSKAEASSQSRALRHRGIGNTGPVLSEFEDRLRRQTSPRPLLHCSS